MSNHADTLTLRLARPAELYDLEELQWRASYELPDYRERLRADPDAVHVPPAQIANGQVIVAELNGRLAGFAAVVGSELDALFVEPELWGRGIGRALIDAAAHEARNRGLTLTAMAKPSERRFYQACGFSIEEEVQTRFGRAFRMSR